MRYMELEKQKLGDPLVLAKLTKLPNFMSGVTHPSNLSPSSSTPAKSPIGPNIFTAGGGQNVGNQKDETDVLWSVFFFFVYYFFYR